MSNNLFALILFGCIMSCGLNIVINNYIYGNKIVQLIDDIDNYNENISIKDANKITMSTIIKWNFIPAILNLIIWVIIIYVVTLQYKTNKDSICGSK
jgi:hypothetical protein